MTTAGLDALSEFQWKPQPAAQKVADALVADFLARCPASADLARQMKERAGTRFYDWIDTIHAPANAGTRARLLEVGFALRPEIGADQCFAHAGGMFPRVNLVAGGTTRIDIKVDSVADFAATWRIGPATELQGAAGGQYRRVLAFTGKDTELWAVERHGYRGYEIPLPDHARTARAAHHLEAFRRREREFENDSRGFDHAGLLADAAIRDLGVDWACDLFFQAERDFWQRRNRAARVQKARQDALGLGWANHDHHTYRSSRHCFTRLIAFLEKIGFRCRERFYAGHEAGWGAQVIEQPTAGITIFADVDMSPEEILGDFSHEPMAQRAELGTVGLWCALHGEAFLQAGMHHLECQFDWHALKDQLEKEAAVKTMDPFTTFPYLRQAFTEGERWTVAEERIASVLAKKQITPQQADQFRRTGAIGSHLENLERNDGYKGFNQQGVSQIIAKTDPRRLAQAVGA